MNELININIYMLVDSYQVNVWQGQKLINEFNTLCRNDDACGKVRRFVAQYDQYKLNDELGIVR